MIIQARFQHFSSRSYKNKEGKDVTFYNVDLYDESCNAPVVVSVSNKDELISAFSNMSFGDAFTCHVRPYAGEKNQYRLVCYDITSK